MTLGASRWWTYQRERFPVLAHGVLIAAFSVSAVAFSALLRDRAAALDGVAVDQASFAVAFATAFLFFLQLRVSDEFKDYEDDRRYRPYRPVPRGLVSLRELGWLAAGAALAQLLLALWLHPPLVPLLAGVWAYLGLMSREFFAPAWLKARPFTYMWTHMLVIPLIDLYATACDWLVAGAPLPRGLAWFLLASFFNGMVVEIGRKIRAPEDEERGVDTYSAVWGRDRAVRAWLGALALTALSAVMAARRVGFGTPVLVVAALALAAGVVAARAFLARPRPGRGRVFERLAGAWTLSMYLSVGAIPFALHVIRAP